MDHVSYYFLSPSNAYDVNIKIEKHEYNSYIKDLEDNHPDQ